MLCDYDLIWSKLKDKLLFRKYFIYCFVYFNLSVIREKGESQNGCYKKTKHPKFSKNGPFLRSADICTRMYQRVRNVRFWKIWRTLFSCNTRFEIRPFAFFSDELLVFLTFNIQYFVVFNFQFHRLFCTFSG